MEVKQIVDYLERSGDTIKDMEKANLICETIELEDGNGWIQYQVDDDVFFVRTIYMNPKHRYDRKMLFHAIKTLARGCGCIKIRFATKRNPDVWNRAYGFKRVAYLMEGDL